MWRFAGLNISMIFGDFLSKYFVSFCCRLSSLFNLFHFSLIAYSFSLSSSSKAENKQNVFNILKMRYFILGRTLAFILLLERSNVEGVHNKDRDLYFVNPCTGSISRDEPASNDEPCITNLPTQSVLPTTAPSLQVTDTPTATPSINVVEKIQCPGEYSECDTASDDNVVQVFFRYTIETSPDVLNPDTNLPALEEKLLEKLAPVMLAHCIVDGDARSLTAISHNNHYHPYKRRKLNTVRRLLPTGICSIPADEHLIEGASFILHIVRFSSFPLQPISLYSFST